MPYFSQLVGIGSLKTVPAVTLFLAMGMLSCITSKPAENHLELLRRVEKQLSDRDWDQALSLIDSLPSVSQTEDILLLKCEALLGSKRLDEARAILSRLSSRPNSRVERVQLQLIDSYWKSGRLAAASTQLEQLVSRFPERLDFQSALQKSLNDQGRRFETLPFLLKKVQLGTTSEADLISLADLDSMVEISAERLSGLLNTDDDGARIAAARTAIAYGRNEKAKQLLERAVQNQPLIEEAWCRWGALLAEEKDETAFRQWAAVTVTKQPSHPLTQYLLARWAVEHEQPAAAARCASEAVRLQPNHAASWHVLGRALAALDKSVLAQKCSTRAKLLDEVITVANAIYRSGLTGDRALKIANLVSNLERNSEAILWLKAHLVEPDEDVVAVTNLLNRLEKHTDLDRGWNTSVLLGELNIDFSSFPLPEFGLQSFDQLGTSIPQVAKIAFTDEADARGLQFSFFNGDDPSTAGRRMFEYTGGGTGILDYDRDGLEDIYFCQGRSWPFDVQQSLHLDSLFRQDRAGRFHDVAKLAGLFETGFSQAIAIGDINQDGWADIYVGNLGANTLWMNLGDGTFKQLDHASGAKSALWTMSSGIADLDGDGLPDIVDINYLQGSDIYTRVCEEDGRLRSCAPVAFPAAPDTYWHNSGDNSFSDFTEVTHFDAPNGDGLGLVIADFENTRQLSVFVANDGVANHFFVPESTDGLQRQSTPFRFRERALESGLAFDRDGKAQACMGIAADDTNRDGLLDLFVTNFYNESNTLYIQHPGLLFLDESHTFGLREPSVPMLGFGCQFLDADNDSFPDLMVANGHVDDLEYKQIPYRMRCQFHRNTNGSHFTELFSDSLGSFFEKKLLGRSMAKLDWNRDGLEDIVISCLDTPAVLLTNQTIGAGNWIAITLVGTNSERDPVGSVVTAISKSTTRAKQLIAGDGYGASNSKRMILGLGDASSQIKVQVAWRSGERSEYDDVLPNRHYIAIEGFKHMWMVE